MSSRGYPSLRYKGLEEDLLLGQLSLIDWMIFDDDELYLKLSQNSFFENFKHFIKFSQVLIIRVSLPISSQTIALDHVSIVCSCNHNLCYRGCRLHHSVQDGPKSDTISVLEFHVLSYLRFVFTCVSFSLSDIVIRLPV